MFREKKLLTVKRDATQKHKETFVDITSFHASIF